MLRLLLFCRTFWGGKDYFVWECWGEKFKIIATSPYGVIADGYLQQRDELTVAVSDGITETGFIFKGYRKITVYIKESVEKQIADALYFTQIKKVYRQRGST